MVPSFFESCCYLGGVFDSFPISAKAPVKIMIEDKGRGGERCNGDGDE